MAKNLSLEAVEQLIEKGGFKTYRLFSGSELIATSDTSTDTETTELLSDLREKIELFGSGAYTLRLKKNNKAQSGTEVIYRFVIASDDDEETSAPTVQISGGLSGEKLEEYVNKRTAEVLRLEREKQEIKDLMKEMQFQMKELQTAKRRPARTKENNILAGLVDMAKIAGLTLIAERYPKSVPLIEKALDTMASGDGGGEDDDDEEETGFEVPEQ